MKQNQRPITTERDKLLKLLIDKGYAKFGYSRDYRADVGQIAGRKGSNSKTNNEGAVLSL